jgi:molybdopterin converting factor small subunit
MTEGIPVDCHSIVRLTRSDKGTARMTVRVLYFGIISDMVGKKSEEIALPADATVGDLLDELSSANPDFSHIVRHARPVLDGKHASREQTLRDGAEIAFMRAVGGGNSQ